MFSAEDGSRVGLLKTGVRVTTAQFAPDGSRLSLGGMHNQPGPKDGEWPEFGVLDRHDIQVTRDDA